MQEVDVIGMDMSEDVTSCKVTDVSKPGFSLSAATSSWELIQEESRGEGEDGEGGH